MVSLDRNGKLAVPERNVQKACIELLRLEGWLVFETHTDARKSMGETGQPDLVAIQPTYPGYTRAVLIECKRSDGGRVRKSQKRWHAEAKRRGVRVLVISDVKQLQEELKQ